MDRRSFITKAALGGTAAAASTLAAPAYAQGNRTLTMVTTWPRGAAGVWHAVEYVSDLIETMSDGAITIEAKAAGELVGAFESFDAVTSGQADMYHGADYYFGGQHQGYSFFSGVPFGMTAQEMMTWYYHDGGAALHDKLGEIFNLKSFLSGNTGAQSGGWFAKEINSAEDFQGLKMRMPGLGGKALGELGASVQTLPGGEVYQALSSGAIDATEWIGPWADEVAGFSEITKIYYTAGFHEPGVALSLAVNRDVFNELTPAHQKIIETAAAASHQWSLSQFLSNNGAALERLISQGVQVREFNDGVWDAFGAATVKVMDSFMDDELFAEIRNSHSASMKATSGWISKSEGAYVAQRNRIFG